MSDPLSSVAGANLSSSISVAVARKALDVAKFEGAAAVSLIRAAGAAAGGGAQSTGNPMPGEPGARFHMQG